MKCFVTGANGYIGRSLLKRLVQQHHQVIGLLHKTIPRQKENGVTYLQGNVAKPESFRSFLKDCDVVFHCAAKVSDYGSKKEFYDVNVLGTKKLVEACMKYDIGQFIYLSHLPYETSNRPSLYSKTKQIAESQILKMYRKTGFPSTIIRPGNVFGPGDATWVTVPVDAINKKRLLLIDNGQGIFLHTYIENLLDALMLCIYEPESIGEIIIITDGDNSISWGTYFNDLATILEKGPLQRSIPKFTAKLVGACMIKLLPPLGITPWISPLAVDILTNKNTYTLEETKNIIDYEPKIKYSEAMEHIATWIKNEYMIKK